MIPFKHTEHREVSRQQMEDVFYRLQTPYKYGVVMSFADSMCDSPTVYRYNGKWYMSFVKISRDTAGSGYDSHLAVSEDLLHWNYVCNTMKRGDEDAWDTQQRALYAAYIENDLYGDYSLNDIKGEYHFAYLGGNLKGYETDPLMIGQCKTKDILNPSAYERFPEPRLMPSDEDARKGETLTLYKSDLFIDRDKITGHLYVNAYNAKARDHRESIFLAVSDNGVDWQRYGDRAVLFDDTPDSSLNIIGDAQILKYGDLYIMLYFVFTKGRTYDTFACSYDLVHWTKWNGEHLIGSSEPYDEGFAHKPCVVVENGVVYHYYCAVNHKNERTIALATSRPMGDD